jgi:hypothetical protein
LLLGGPGRATELGCKTAAEEVVCFGRILVLELFCRLFFFFVFDIKPTDFVKKSSASQAEPFGYRGLDSSLTSL